MKKLFAQVLFLLVLLTVVLTACDPVPGRDLSPDEKRADMMWLFSIFGENYAPIALKEKLYGFKLADLNKKYLARAGRTKTNEDFYLLMNQYVAEFHDAHTSLKLTPSSLPGRTQIAFLGFSGERSGDAFWVRERLPTLNNPGYPIRVGDLITHIDGIPVLEYIDKYLTPYRNLGNTESNHTILMGNLFTRISLMNPMPTKPDIELTVRHAAPQGTQPAVEKVSVPWIVQDIVDFRIEQKAASPKNGQSDEEAKKKSALILELKDPRTGQPFELAFLDQTGRAITQADIERMYNSRHTNFSDQFRFTEISGWTTNPEVLAGSNAGSLTALRKKRYIPENAIAIQDSAIFPAYVFTEEVLTKAGKSTGHTKTIGYIHIADFSPDTTVIKDGKAIQVSAEHEFRNTLKLMQKFGVKDLIIDTLNNPGGSLFLSLDMAQALSNKPIKMPGMQFGADDYWIDYSLAQSRDPRVSNETREVYRRLHEELLNVRNKGGEISKTFPMDTMVPYSIKPNYDLKSNFNIKLLVNEGNASCGDIFPMILQENGLAEVVGMQTMGAGGNVVEFTQAPNSHADVRQTRSLVVKKDGSYLENNGVTPDIVVNFRKNLDKTSGNWQSAIKYVTDLIMKRKPMDPSLFLADEAESKKAQGSVTKDDSKDKKPGGSCSGSLGSI